MGKDTYHTRTIAAGPISRALRPGATDQVSTSVPPIPPIPQFEVTFSFEYQVKLGVIDVYQTAIQMMYDLAQRPWIQVVQAVDSKQFGNYNVLFLFINTEPRSAPDQLQVMHCVSTLYQVIRLMTDGVLFYQNRAAILLRHKHIGGMSIMPIDDPRVVSANNSSNDSIDDEDGAISSASNDWSRGHIKDRDNPQFSINYQFMGRSISTKAVSMAIFEAMTVAAPHPKNTGCQEIAARNPDGGCAIIVEGVPGAHQFTYQWATRALKLLYQDIVVAKKKFGDVKLDLMYDGTVFGELPRSEVPSTKPDDSKYAEDSIQKEDLIPCVERGKRDCLHTWKERIEIFYIPTTLAQHFHRIGADFDTAGKLFDMLKERGIFRQASPTLRPPGYTAPPKMSSTGAMLDTMFGGSNLDKLTKKDCYTQLIDSYRLRVEDDYKYACDNHGLYNEEDPRPEFAQFLNLAEKRTGLLPGWWNKETRAACEAMAADGSKENWADLSCAVEKSDIMEHYKDHSMPMKLRLLAEKVYGKRVQGGL
ncbi:MAG: hypothetical protein Q9216_006374 [Gyalolechia sp. 2 TL-2023]